MATKCCQPLLDGCCAKDAGNEQLVQTGKATVLKPMWGAIMVSVLHTVCNHQLLLLLLLQVLKVVAVETQDCDGKDKSTQQSQAWKTACCIPLVHQLLQRCCTPRDIYITRQAWFVTLYVLMMQVMLCMLQATLACTCPAVSHVPCPAQHSTYWVYTNATALRVGRTKVSGNSMDAKKQKWLSSRQLPQPAHCSMRTSQGKLHR